jgi:hypothetical protein
MVVLTRAEPERSVDRAALLAVSAAKTAAAGLDALEMFEMASARKSHGAETLESVLSSATATKIEASAASASVPSFAAKVTAVETMLARRFVPIIKLPARWSTWRL